MPRRPERLAALDVVRVRAAHASNRWAPVVAPTARLLTRDTWMHRVDVTRATGREMVLTSEHDGRIVVDCVLDWARKHDRPFNLVLSGLAGGRFEVGSGGPDIEIDAVEFVRALSGRGVREEILGTRVVFCHRAESLPGRSIGAWLRDPVGTVGALSIWHESHRRTRMAASGSIRRVRSSGATPGRSGSGPLQPCLSVDERGHVRILDRSGRRRRVSRPQESVCACRAKMPGSTVDPVSGGMRRQLGRQAVAARAAGNHGGARLCDHPCHIAFAGIRRSTQT